MAIITEQDAERFEIELARRLIEHEQRIAGYEFETVDASIGSVILVTIVLFIVVYPILMGILRKTW